MKKFLRKIRQCFGHRNQSTPNLMLRESNPSLQASKSASTPNLALNNSQENFETNEITNTELVKNNDTPRLEIAIPNNQEEINIVLPKETLDQTELNKVAENSKLRSREITETSSIQQERSQGLNAQE
jgi:hypothetical protein